MTRFALLPLTLWLLGCGGSQEPAPSPGADDSMGDDEPAESGDDAGSFGGVPTAVVAHDSVVRRLSRAELDATLEVLVGDSSASAARLLPEDPFSPYDNDTTLQSASASLIDSLEVLATEVAASAVSEAGLQVAELPCAPAAPGDAECFRQITESLLYRAFRRPVSAEEVDRYAPLLAFATEDNPEVPQDFYTAVRLLIQSLLQDPEFLYRIEIGTPTPDPRIVALNDHEIASRLSYLLVGTMPDAELLAAARAGQLRDPSERQAAATRLLATPRAQTQLERFHAMWLGYRALPHAPELAQAFDRETRALVRRVVFEEPGSYLELFTRPETFIDATLAEHYGLPEPTSGGDWVAYGDSGRAGILSHGSVLSAFGKFSDTSPTQRGIFVRTRLLCEPVLAPPPTVNTDEPPAATDAECKTDRYQQHRSSPACASCHAALDPIGFGLENYDLQGRFREHDDDNPDCTLDGAGELTPYGAFRGPGELARLLVENQEIDDCFVRQLLTFALGRPLAPEEELATQAWLERFRDSGHSLPTLLIEYVGSEPFARRRVPAGDGP